VQKSGWDVIISDGWASKYWPCYGAIMQLGVYPPKNSNVGLDDFPEIMDFEPKKREMYESVTEGQEILSSSADNTYTLSGGTTSENNEVGFSIAGYGIKTPGDGSTTSYNYNTDTLRENRETKSHSTNFSQMYQLFNGYHLGTNRAVFVIAPRPHTGSDDAQMDFNLVDGPRKLEGIQDVFLVVNLPKKLTGFCINASIDTGHIVHSTTTQPMTIMTRNIVPGGPNPEPFDDSVLPPWVKDPWGDGGDPGGGGGGGYPGGGGGGGGGGDAGGSTEVNQLVVTRRLIQSCGTFDENGNLTVNNIFPDNNSPFRINIVNEDLVFDSRSNKILSTRPTATVHDDKAEIANQMNLYQRSILKSMISGFSAGNYEPRSLIKTQTFLTQAKFSLQKLDLPLSELADLHYITYDEVAVLNRSKIITIGDVFKDSLSQSNNPIVQKLRNAILSKIQLGRPIIPG
jgi:hypothetical protein